MSQIEQVVPVRGGQAFANASKACRIEDFDPEIAIQVSEILDVQAAPVGMGKNGHALGMGYPINELLAGGGRRIQSIFHAQGHNMVSGPSHLVVRMELDSGNQDHIIGVKMFM